LHWKASVQEKTGEEEEEEEEELCGCSERGLGELGKM